MKAPAKTDHALERLVFFSDAVFAIAITLLILEVHVPHLPRHSADVVYLQALADLTPSFIGYIISFWVIGMFWLGHHRVFGLASRQSRKVLGWNLFLLGVIAFMLTPSKEKSLSGAPRLLASRRAARPRGRVRRDGLRGLFTPASPSLMHPHS